MNFQLLDQNEFQQLAPNLCSHKDSQLPLNPVWPVTSTILPS